MMDCYLVKIGDTDDGRTLYKCKGCGRQHASALPPERIHRMCGSPVEMKPEDIIAELPEESRKLLFGDRVAQFLAWFGAVECGGCAKRKQRLNDGHQWVLERFT
jgi:hypothetical protein